MKPLSTSKFFILLIVLLFAALSLTGCYDTKREIAKLDNKATQLLKENNDAAGIAIRLTRAEYVKVMSILVAGRPAEFAKLFNGILESNVVVWSEAQVVSLTNAVAKAEKSAEVAEVLVTQNTRIAGPALVDQTPRVLGLLSTNFAEVKAAQEAERVRGLEIVTLLKDKDAKTQHLVQLGEQKEAEMKAAVGRTWWKIFCGFFGVGLIGGLVYLLIFSGVGIALLPFLGKALGWCLAKLPSVASWIGVTSYDAVHSAVIALQEIKHKAAASGDVKTVALVRRETASAMSQYAATVAKVKAVEGYKNTDSILLKTQGATA